MNQAASAIRPPAVAGQFYPAQANMLRQQILALLGEAPAADLPGLKAILVPHAGYVYSGSTAARLYAALLGRREIRRVVLLGPAHRVPVAGMVLPAAAHWATPLGLVPIDQAGHAVLSALPGVTVDDAPHAPEHALEVHLPFLQTVLPNVAILPVLVGQCPPEQVAAALEAVWGGPETLILISTDLSHYHPYETAQALDQSTVAAMLACQPGLVGERACGARPANGFFLAARKQGLQSQLIDCRNSGDTAGDKARVVGYAAIAYLDPQARLGQILLRLARGVIEHALGGAPVTVPAMDALQSLGAVFVTLTLDGRLRGCIGSLEAHRKLVDDVVHNARAAAFKDPRFTPLQAGELGRLRVEVSLLEAPQAMSCIDEADALRQLRPGIDGLILSDGGHRATYLPQVWAQLPEPARFLANLKEKAGLPASHWSPELRLQRYTVRKWQESVDI